MFGMRARSLTAWINRRSGVIIFFGTLFGVYLTLMMFAFIVVDFSTKAGIGSPRWATLATEITFKWFGLQTLAANSETFLSALLSLSLIFVTVWFALLAWFGHINRRRQLLATQTVEIREIEDPGRDDIATLSNLLKDARRTIIFAGSFDWLLEHAQLRAIVSDLAVENRIKLVSSCSEGRVEESFEAHPDIKENLMRRVKCNDEKDIRLTVVEYDNRDLACCTMTIVDQGTGGARRQNMLVRASRPEGRVLLNIIDKFCEVEDWRE